MIIFYSLHCYYENRMLSCSLLGGNNLISFIFIHLFELLLVKKNYKTGRNVPIFI